MTRCLVFDTQEAAQSAVDKIDANGRAIFQARGYQITKSGDVVGKRLSDNADMPSAETTKTWAVPIQRLDGKWIVPHPENQPGAATVIDKNGTTAAMLVMSGVSSDAVEDFSSEWFPVGKLIP